MNDILTVSGLNKSYGDFSLKDVTFSLPEGCITGFKWENLRAAWAQWSR